MLSAGRADVFVRGASAWSLEQHLDLPAGSGCGQTVAPDSIALSGDGATLLVGDPNCETSGQSASGRVHAYSRSGSSWSLAETIDSPEQQTLQRVRYVDCDFRRRRNRCDRGHAEPSLPASAGATWVLEHDGGGWHSRTRLTASTPEAGTSFSCPTIVGSGSRIRLLCGAYDTVGSGIEKNQGSIYVFERPTGGWTSSGFIARAFATDSFDSDVLGRTGWGQVTRVFGVSADGSVIDATIGPGNLANGNYPNDRIGYEFRAPPLLAPPTLINGKRLRPARQRQPRREEVLRPLEGLGDQHRRRQR